MSRLRTRGQSLVEFALVLPVLLIVLLGIFAFGRAIFAYNAVSNAAREGMRVAIVNQNAAAIEAEALAATTGMDPNEITVTFTPCTGPTVLGCMVKVKVAYNWSAITPIIGSVVGPRELASEAGMVVERIYSAAPTPPTP
jgi:Flp pilus assembly protein TadG